MIHHLLVGTWTPPGAIFTFAFNDETYTLELIKRTATTVDEPISWMTFGHDKKSLYGAAMKKWTSCTVASPTDIVPSSRFPMDHDPLAAQTNSRTRAIFVLAAQILPYYVYGAPFYEHAGAGNVFAVDAAGTLVENVQNYAYSPNSGVHGMVFDETEEYLYSADLSANKIWTHRKDANGQLALCGVLDAPDPQDHPRWVALKGTYLYVLMEAGNRLAVYVIDAYTHLPTFTQLTYPLIPPGIPNGKTGMYRSDVCVLSHSKDYLFATSRANSSTLTGYIAAFKLGAVGNIERQICLNPTPTSGGRSNAVAPADWTDEWIALTDTQEGWIEIYRWKDEFLGRVAHCDVKEPGFGMNAIWYD